MHRATIISFLVCCLGLVSVVTAQAQCGSQGGGVSCAVPTDCCSVNGYCGAGEQYCGTGCQTGFGAACGGGVQSPSAVPTTAPVTVVPTSVDTPTTLSTTAVVTTVPSPVITTTTTTTTESSSSSSSTASTSVRGTFQLQPTGKPSGAAAAQDKGVESRLALVVVFMAGLLMV